MSEIKDNFLNPRKISSSKGKRNRTIKDILKSKGKQSGQKLDKSFNEIEPTKNKSNRHLTIQNGLNASFTKSFRSIRVKNKKKAKFKRNYNLNSSMFQ